MNISEHTDKETLKANISDENFLLCIRLYIKNLAKHNFAICPEDVVQDSILKAIEYLDSGKAKFPNEQALFNWMFTIAKNTFINHFRKIKNNRNRSLEIDLCRDLVKTSVFNEAESKLFFLDCCSIKSLYKDKSSQKHFKIMDMLERGFSYEDISNQLSIPLGTLKPMIFHFRKKMRAIASKSGLV